MLDPTITYGIVLLVVAIAIAIVVWRLGRAGATQLPPPEEQPTLPAPPEVRAPAPPAEVREPSKAPSPFMAGLARTRERLSGSLRRLLGGGDPAALEALEEDLIAADVG